MNNEQAPVWVTTPIYYVNAEPHIGTALTTVVADVYVKWLKSKGFDARLSTGVDENALKVFKAHEGKNFKQALDTLAAKYQQVFDSLDIQVDKFVRTTTPEHSQLVQETYVKLKENGLIYEGTYDGYYHLSDECYVDYHEPGVTELRSEPCLYFKISSLKHDIASRLFFCSEKDANLNEALALIDDLKDICITRLNVGDGFGVPVPDDARFIFYVWFDALCNYLPCVFNAVQFVGKDIYARFHALIWNGILSGLNIPGPHRISSHGWILDKNGHKFSKSLQNAPAPQELLDSLEFLNVEGTDVDTVRLLLVTLYRRKGDSTYDPDALKQVYNTILANSVGNLFWRVASIARKLDIAHLPLKPVSNDGELHYINLDFNEVVKHVQTTAQQAQNTLAQKEPWKLSADEATVILAEATAKAQECINLLWPICPNFAERCEAVLTLNENGWGIGDTTILPLPAKRI